MRDDENGLSIVQVFVDDIIFGGDDEASEAFFRGNEEIF